MSSRASFFIVHRWCVPYYGSLLRTGRLTNLANNTDECHQNAVGGSDPQTRINTGSCLSTFKQTNHSRNHVAPPALGTCLTCHHVIGPRTRRSTNHISPLKATLELAIGHFCVVPSRTPTRVRPDNKDQNAFFFLHTRARVFQSKYLTWIICTPLWSLNRVK